MLTLIISVMFTGHLIENALSATTSVLEHGSFGAEVCGEKRTSDNLGLIT